MASKRETEMTLRQLQLMEDALRIDLIVESILDNLSYPDLKTCRLVCQSFRSISSSLLSKKLTCQIYLTYDDSRNDFRHYRQIHRRWGTCPHGSIPPNQSLSDLNALLKNCHNFPCTHLSVYCGPMDNPNIQEFFLLQGPALKTLKFSQINCSSPFSLEGYFNILRNQAPILEKLTLEGVSEFRHLPDIPIHFPRLKSFTWQDMSFTFPLEVMRGSPNLKIVNESVDEERIENYFPSIIEAGKTDCVQKLHCDITREELDGFARFMTAGPINIRHIVIPALTEEPFEGRMDFLTRLLEVTRETLEYLTVSSYFHEEGIPIPRIPGLKILTLGSGEGGRRWRNPNAFPNQTNLDELLNFDFTLDVRKYRVDRNGAAGFSHTLFPGILTGVKRLEISDRARNEYMEELAVMCPNVKEIVVDSFPAMHCQAEDERVNLELVLPSVFRIFRKIEKLFIRIRGQRFQPFCLDSTFTGFSPRTCERLRGAYEVDDALEVGYEGFRDQPGIFELEELKTIHIAYESSSHFLLDKVSKKIIPVTWVSSRYGFQLRGVQVTMEYDTTCVEYEGSEELKPHFDSLASCLTLNHKKFVD